MTVLPVPCSAAYCFLFSVIIRLCFSLEDGSSVVTSTTCGVPGGVISWYASSPLPLLKCDRSIMRNSNPMIRAANGRNRIRRRMEVLRTRGSKYWALWDDFRGGRAKCIILAIAASVQPQAGFPSVKHRPDSCHVLIAVDVVRLDLSLRQRFGLCLTRSSRNLWRILNVNTVAASSQIRTSYCETRGSQGSRIG